MAVADLQRDSARAKIIAHLETCGASGLGLYQAGMFAAGVVTAVRDLLEKLDIRSATLEGRQRIDAIENLLDAATEKLDIATQEDLFGSCFPDQLAAIRSELGL